MLPVLGRKIVERQEFTAIFLQAFGGLLIFDVILFNEKIERGLGIDTGLGEADILEIILGFALE